MEFTVCFTLKTDIKREKINIEKYVKKEEVIQEILEKINRGEYYNIKDINGSHWINTSLIRYIRVVSENNSFQEI